MIILEGKKNIINERSPLLWSLEEHANELSVFVEKYQNQQEEIGINLESVCGEDSRSEINHVSINSSNHHRATCHLAITFKGGLKAATGFFIGPRKVVTAAHCIYDIEYNWGYADKIIVRPGLHRNSEELIIAPFRGDFSEGVIVPKQWKESGNWEYDFGLITLASDELYNRAGRPNLVLWDATDENCRDISCDCWGYPDIAPFPNQRLYSNNEEKIAEVNEHILYSEIDISSGNSGGALVTRGEFAVGICSHQYNGCITPNGFTRVTTYVKKAIEDYPTI